MKRKVAIFIKSSLQLSFFWYLFQFYSSIIDKVYFYKIEVENDIKNTNKKKLESTFFSKLKVLNGPFSGLKYPSFLSFGSTVYPKLLGSYESELHKFISLLIKKGELKRVIDIGCAEGYYAVGFAMKMKEVEVYGYDIDAKALQKCQEMAELNNVSERLFLRSFFTKETFKDFDLTIPTLIIADCEGYESELFDQEVALCLKHAFLIIELHEFINRNILDILLMHFNTTHKYQVIHEKDKKASDYKELVKLNRFQKELILNEMRPEKMKWLLLEPING